MKLVDTQIPISSKNWVNFDFLSTLKIISNSMTNKDVSELKFAISNVKESNDVLLAPFCILLEEKPVREKKADGTIKDIWFKTASKVLTDSSVKSRLSNYDKDNIKEEIMLEAFEYLNREAFDDHRVSKINHFLSKLI